MEKEEIKKQKTSLRKTGFIYEISHNKELYAMLLPFFALFLLMTVVPIIVSFALSFSYFNMFSFPEFVGLTNYLNLFLHDDIFYIAIKNTLLFAILTGPVSYVLCFFIAWFINDFSRKTRVLLTFIFYAPSLSGAVYFIWQFFFSGDSYGLINGVLINLGLIIEPVQWLTNPAYSIWILMIVQLWMSLGAGFLAFIAGFKGVDETLYEAGEIDGIKNRFQELFYITIPMMKPQLLFSAIMQIAAAFSVSTISMQLCGFPSKKYAAHTLVLHIMDYGTIRYEMGYACAIAVVLFIMMLVFRRGINLLLRFIGDE
jgi:multiple sugar transport system permease protein